MLSVHGHQYGMQQQPVRQNVRKERKAMADCERTFAIQNWERLGRPIPPPHDYKAMLVLQIAAQYGLKVFVETGTFMGDMLIKTIHAFEKYFTVEVSERWYKYVRECVLGHHFESGAGKWIVPKTSFANLVLERGNSLSWLPSVMQRTTKPCLFWLDAHEADINPLLGELALIGRHKAQRHAAILIDDARLMNGTYPAWPVVDDVIGALATYWPDHKIMVQNDIIVALPV